MTTRNYKTIGESIKYKDIDELANKLRTKQVPDPIDPESIARQYAEWAAEKGVKSVSVWCQQDLHINKVRGNTFRSVASRYLAACFRNTGVQVNNVQFSLIAQ